MEKTSIRLINDAGLAILKASEGLRLRAYRDTGGVFTIGWGHTKGVRAGQVITIDEAESLLRADLAWAEEAVETRVLVPISDNQFSALVSFVFNVGETAFANSTLLRKLNAGDYRGAADQFLRWNKDNGRVLGGLVKRRARERELFLS